MGKTSDQRSAFDGRRRLTLLGMCNQCGEIFRFSVFAFGDVVCSLQSAGSGDVDTVFVRSVGTRRNDAVTGKQDRSVETFKLFFLFPPGISVVSCQMLVFFQLGGNNVRGAFHCECKCLYLFLRSVPAILRGLSGHDR